MARADLTGMMNSIGAVGSTQMMSMSSAHQGRGTQGKGPFDAVSGVLGMSADDIAAKVRAGSSLDDLASEKGVSHDDLVAALKAGAPAELQGSEQLTSMVEHLASQKGMAGPGGPPPGPPPAGGPGGPSGVMSGQKTDSQQAMLDSLSELLDASSEGLEDSLQSGTSLTDLLDQKGVSLSQLAESIQAGFLIDQRL